MQNVKTSYFFDLPLADVSRSICDALRILYHGNPEGTFGEKWNDRVDLEQIHAIKIGVCHSSTNALSDDYEYNLVFYRNSIADSIWEPASREKHAELRGLTQRVTLNKEKSLLADRLLGRLPFIRSTRPVQFAKYESVPPPDHSVPLEYHRQIHRDFECYIMRTIPDFPLVRSLFRAQGLDMAKRKFASYSSDNRRPIITYTLKNPPTPNAPMP